MAEIQEATLLQEARVDEQTTETTDENVNEKQETTEATEKAKDEKVKDGVKKRTKENEKQETTEKKENEQEATEQASTNPTNLASFKQSLKPQEKKVLETFMASSVYDKFMGYLETFFREKDTLIHRINCYCFKSLADFSIRIQGKAYEIKKGQIIYIQKDSFGNSLLRNNKLERIM